MNLKPNLWTLLFVLIAGAWWYTAQQTPVSVADSFICNIDFSQNFAAKDSISEKDFKDGRKLYELLFKNQIDPKSFPGLTDPKANYFRIEQAEIAKLFAINCGQHVYAVPFVDMIENVDSSGQCLPYINLAFSTIPPGKNADDVLPPGGQFYNFSAPCPPLCDTSSVMMLCEKK